MFVVRGKMMMQLVPAMNGGKAGLVLAYPERE